MWARSDGGELVIVHADAPGGAARGRPPRADHAGTAEHPRRALPAAAGRARWSASPGPDRAEEQAFLAIGPGAERWLINAAAAGATRVRRKIAEAVELAKLHGAEAVDEALAVAADAGRFGEGDLAAILAHHRRATVIAFPARASEQTSLQRSTAVLGGLRRMTVKTPAPPPLPAELDTLLRRLRMPYVRRAAPDVIATAASQRWEPAEVLRVLLAEEAAGRDQRDDPHAPPRLRAARRQDVRRLGRATPRRSPRPPSTRSGHWNGSTARRTCASAGPSGTGKSHLVEALGHLAIDHGKTVAWHTLESLAVLLRRHRADDTVTKAIGRLIRSDLIVIDLCRRRDYADTPSDMIRNSLLRTTSCVSGRSGCRHSHSPSRNASRVSVGL